MNNGTTKERGTQSSNNAKPAPLFDITSTSFGRHSIAETRTVQLLIVRGFLAKPSQVQMSFELYTESERVWRW